MSYGAFGAGFVLYAPKCTALNTSFYDQNGGEVFITLAQVSRLQSYASPTNGQINLTLSKYAPDVTDGGWTYNTNFTNALKSISIEDDVTAFEIYDGCLYSIQNKALICTGAGRTSVTVKPGTTRIGFAAFSNQKSLTSITGTESLTAIADQAFRECTSLTSFSFPSTLTQIGTSAFQGSGLTSVNIPNVSCGLGGSCFRYCSSLTTVRDGTTVIGQAAYGDCTALQTVYVTNATQILNAAFMGCTSVTYFSVAGTLVNNNSNAYPNSGYLLTAGPAGGGYDFEYGWTTQFGQSSGSYCLAIEYVEEITFPSTTTSLQNYLTHGRCKNVKKIYSYAMTAPSTQGYTFTNVGDNTKDSGTNELHVPVGATGYDSGQWAVLVNSHGFTLIYDL